MRMVSFAGGRFQQPRGAVFPRTTARLVVQAGGGADDGVSAGIRVFLARSRQD